MSGFSGAPASASSNPPTTSGQLTFVSTAALAFLPYNGDTIRIGGTVMQIPAAGIAGLGAPTSVFLNGVAAQTLVINTTYLIYAFSNSGTVTADFSTTGHSISATAGNIGTEIKTGDNTRSLIGQVRIGGTVIYASDIQTASWFNRRNKFGSVSQSLAAAGNSAALAFITWADESYSIGTIGFLSNSGSTNITVWQDQIDGSNVGVTSQGSVLAVNAQVTFNSTKLNSSADGNHSYQSVLSATGGTASSGGTSFVQIRG